MGLFWASRLQRDIPTTTWGLPPSLSRGQHCRSGPTHGTPPAPQHPHKPRGPKTAPTPATTSPDPRSAPLPCSCLPCSPRSATSPTAPRSLPHGLPGTPPPLCLTPPRTNLPGHVHLATAHPAWTASPMGQRGGQPQRTAHHLLPARPGTPALPTHGPQTYAFHQAGDPAAIMLCHQLLHHLPTRPASAALPASPLATHRSSPQHTLGTSKTSAYQNQPEQCPHLATTSTKPTGKPTPMQHPQHHCAISAVNQLSRYGAK